MVKYRVRTVKEKQGLENYSSLVQILLHERGINTREGAEKFFAPDYERDIHDPFLLPDMDKAVERIFEAINKQEKIVIFSDYDADGIPGGVILHDFFKKIGHTNFSNYIPHRHREGFGLNSEAVNQFEKDKVGLVITVDCGITDIEEAQLLKRHKIDLIITDHHLPGEKLPHAIAVVDAKRLDSQYPFKELCGAGVAFKLVQAILKKYSVLKQTSKEVCSDNLHQHFEKVGVGWEKWLLDVAGIATLSDMVPLLDENRAIAYYGLKVLRKTPRIGLQKIFRKMKIDLVNITEDDIGFSLTPRINAASRIGEPEDAFKMLIADNEVEGEKWADHLESLNNSRKGQVAAITKEARKIIEERYAEKKKVIVIGNPDWKPGLLGLVANSLLETNGGAVFVWGREGGESLKASCRADESVNVVELMNLVPKDIILDFGGHHASGGLTIASDKVHLLEDHLNLAYEKVSTLIETSMLEIDAVISGDDLVDALWNDIDKLAPFGVGNPKPVFLLKDAEIISAKTFGKEKNHTEIVVKGKKNLIPAIAFFKSVDSWGRELKVGQTIDMAINLEKSYFRGRAERRLRIIEIL